MRAPIALVAVADAAARQNSDARTAQRSITCFILSAKGLMYGPTFEGPKITRVGS